jgi:FtsH-binding integral membrane protein
MSKGGFVKSSLYKKLFSGGTIAPGSPPKLYNLIGGAVNSEKQFFKLLNDKKGFLFAVFINLIIQAGITYYVMMHYKKNQEQVKDQKKKNPISNGMAIALFIAETILIVMISLVPMNMYFKFILFCIFSALSGISLVNIKSRFESKIIQGAILGTIIILALMVIFGIGLLYLGIQLSPKIGGILFFLLLMLIIFELISFFVKASGIIIKLLLGFSLFLFSAYIVYDTNQILQRNYYGDFVTASMDYYLDIINIFIDLLHYSQ